MSFWVLGSAFIVLAFVVLRSSSIHRFDVD